MSQHHLTNNGHVYGTVIDSGAVIYYKDSRGNIVAIYHKHVNLTEHCASGNRIQGNCGQSFLNPLSW